MPMQFKELTDYVIVKVDGSIFNEDTGFKGVEGKSIVIDPSWDPQIHVKIQATVVAIPTKLSKRPIAQVTKGHPKYNMISPFKYKHMDDIEQEIKVGDRVYFHFNMLLSDGKNLISEKERLYKISYNSIICAVRPSEEEEGYDEVVMIGGYCLIEPDLESWEETLIPVAEVVNGKVLEDKYGNPILKPKDQWIIRKIQPEAKYLRGTVINVGSPLKGDDDTLREGDKIMYRPNADWQMNIEGHKFFCIQQRHILASVLED